MNKRFFTLLAAGSILLGGGAYAQEGKTIGHSTTLRPQVTTSAKLPTVEPTASYTNNVKGFTDGWYYQLISEVGGKPFALAQVRDIQSGKLTLKLIDVSKESNPGAFINATLWKVTAKEDGTSGLRFTYTNKETNVPLIVDLQDLKKTAGVDAADPTVLEGCQMEWTWYAYKTTSEANGFDYAPVYAYYGDGNSKVAVLEAKSSDELVAVTYDSNAAGSSNVSNTKAVKFKPVLASGIVLKADDLNRKVDFQEKGSFKFASTVTPTIGSDFFTEFKAVNYDKSQVSKDFKTFTSALGPVAKADADNYVFFQTTDGKKHLFVDTEFYSDESKELKLSLHDKALPKEAVMPDKLGKMNQPLYEARSYFKVTYYPSQDSLLIEPLNAFAKDASNATAPWDEADKAFNSEFNDQVTLWGGATPATNSDKGKVVVRIANLTGGTSVITAKNTEVDGTYKFPGSLKTKFTFANRTFTYLNRTTVEEGLYFIKENVGQKRYIVDNLNGKIMYDAPAQDQNYKNAPATMWVVKHTSCVGTADEAKNATVAVYNREYGVDGKPVFEGQLYKDESGIYFLDQKYDGLSGGKVEEELSNKDNYDFTAVDDNDAKTSKYHGYNYYKAEDLTYEKYFLNYNLWANPDLYLNYNKATGKFLPSAGQTTSYQLEVERADNNFGYVGTLPQLVRSAYKVKVSDNNLIDNDKTYLALVKGVGAPDYYKPLTEDEITAGKGKLAVFYLKADQVNTKGDKAYILVDINDESKTLQLANGWEQAHVEDGTGYLSHLSLENRANDRSSAFFFSVDERPLYKDLGVAGDTAKIYRKRGTGAEYLFEDGTNQSLAPKAKAGFSYLGLTAEKVAPIGEKSTDAFYIDYVTKSNARMPQYLLAFGVDSVKDGKWCDTHGYNPADDDPHTVPFNGYIAGRFLVNLSDSVKGALDKVHNADYYKFDNYTRLGFVQGVHQVEGTNEYLYIAKAGVNLDTLAKKFGVISPTDLADTKKFEKKTLDGKHQNYAFSFRYVNVGGDVTTGDLEDFLLESKGDDSEIGSFKGAWVKIHNGVPVLAEYSVSNGNHTTTDKINELITQAQIFNLKATSEAPVANESISTSDVTVIGGAGNVTIYNAAGKTVTISNILGQAVAKQVLSSDNVTLAAPKGVVIVAVEGEKAVKAVVK